MEHTNHEVIVEWMRTFPNISRPETFGFHANADISKDIGESNLLFDTLLLCGGSGGGGGSGGQDDVLRGIVESVLHGFPKEFDTTAAAKKFPVVYSDSMNTVLT